MSFKLLKVYHRLPPVIRSAVATVRGWHLRRSRYGKESASLTAETLERDTWTAERWNTWTQERIAHALHQAATRVPYYRDYWQRRPPFWVWNAAMRQLYLSSYHLAPDLIPHYLDAMAHYRVAYLAGYPSSLFALAQEALRLGRDDLPMLAVHTNAEPLLPVQRETIAKAFRCPVRETYGMAETVAGASECSAGRLHQWPEFGYVEVLPDGELVCSGLLNPDMPLIRYRVGDRGTKPSDQSPCPCGRGLPLMGSIDGRRDDVLITKDGRLVGRLDPVFKGTNGIREAQIIQETLDHIRVLVAPAPEFSKMDEMELVENLLDRLGDVRVTISLVEVVPRTANGKVRAVICNVPAEAREEARRRAHHQT